MMAEEIYSESQEQSEYTGRKQESGGRNLVGDGASTSQVAADSDNEIELESDIEVEEEDPDILIEHPFDPEKIKVRTANVVVDQLVARIEHNEIDLNPSFQRAFVWNKRRQSRLIESLLLRIPIPVFYVAADEEENWSVVDGVQRMSTIYNYVSGGFLLGQLEYLDQLVGSSYDTLPRAMQRRINETQLVVNIIEPGTPDDVMFNIFRRINTGGMPLRGQEIRNALYPGPVRDYLENLANTMEFLDATDRAIKPDRMDDRECVLRFLAFYITSWKHYNANNLEGYLGQTMTKVNEMTQESRDLFAEDFKNAMHYAHLVFGDDAFRKRYSRNDSRKPISKALFESWSVQFARCSQSQLKLLVERREQIKDRFIALMNEDDEFEKAISLSTGIPKRVQKRFSAIAELIEDFAEC